jgi:hypothetical protein
VENEANSDRQEKKFLTLSATTKVNIFNLVVLIIMLLMSTDNKGEGPLMAFFVGGVVGFINLIAAIVFSRRDNSFAAITCVIWTLVLPIIGFGCCASGLKLGG